MPFEKSPDTIQIADKIKAKIANLEGLVKQIKPVALKTAQNSAEYEKQLAITIVKLQRGEDDICVECKIEGKTLDRTPHIGV